MLALFTLGPDNTFIITIAVCALIISIKSPHIAFILWLCVLCFVPIWFGLRFGGFWSPSALMGCALLIGVAVRKRIRFTDVGSTDVLVLIFAVLITLLTLGGEVREGHAMTALSQWIVAFLVVRALTREVGTDFVYTSIALLFTIVAAFAVIESVTKHNLFHASIPLGTEFSTISKTQQRGGEVRVEFSFGHAIALGNSVAMAIPFALAARLPGVARAACVALLSTAAILTISRSAILTMGLAVLLSLWALDGRTLKLWLRTVILVVVGIAAYFALPWVTSVFGKAATETQSTGAYRDNLMSMFPLTKPFGLADGYSETVSGIFTWHGLHSLDNTFLRLAVNFGWLPMLVVAGALAASVWRVVSRRGSPADISLAAVIPALFTVALITQFGAVVFMCLGISAAVAAERRELRRRDRDRDHSGETKQSEVVHRGALAEH